MQLAFFENAGRIFYNSNGGIQQKRDVPTDASLFLLCRGQSPKPMTD